MEKRLLAILVCPLTGGPLRYDAKRQELLSGKAGLAYPIRDGIPVLLADEARPLAPEECAGLPGGAPEQPPPQENPPGRQGQ
ncbi:MAG: Trm112 family protein [Gammaproteobacteria bacterium]|nr:Trm112 family protein [Gammaproteobacteria bacterium]MDD9864252.1 Trm112 family protein [Gammaproteobacteria bacterium]